MFARLPQKAFSLIELMVVIAIVAIISAISIGSLMAIQKNSRDAQRQADVQVLKGALQQFYADMNKYPSTLTNSVSLNNCTGAGTTPVCTVSKTYLSKVPKDPNGTAYYYLAYTDVPANPCSLAGGVETGTCHKYFLCAKLENPPSGSTCNDSAYNYQLTPL